MNRVSNLSKLTSASFFDKNTLKEVIGGSDDAVSANIVRWIESGRLIQLKKGIYVTKEYYLQCSDKQSYGEFVANILKKPSYLSGEYVLQKYGILSESVFSITSVTRKKTRAYNNKLGVFLYSNIKDKLFGGFNIVFKSGYEIKEATKTKALFDYLYFRLWRVPEVNPEIISSFRLNLGDFVVSDFDDINYLVDLSGVKKFTNLVAYLKETTK
ncbi:hypothetical protein COS78_02400 [Candidatus Shapirobacteria bacterium CG06_land_8_20_14_3_00_40_12]|uniref:Transcriptional regulator n=2 Tax=Candidatus Shapironibacteriota TaxID=1752721 RepID=A0A2M7TRY3_9BACT|nr:MAG: hypothetical protein COS78_02400 [Candidatus Shapirobacteria bacterium CG06_land_8_20_14_3_00_40_12]PIZ58319.1 MAG: hypothetical protein COY20_03915 [Candidatus Shapirobacteria bacterium CG_4_10_14_0_2_um_filter_40_12]